MKWLVIDGFGFHEGYFNWHKWCPQKRIRPRLSGYAARSFDCGLGRSIWFVAGNDAVHAARLIAAFDADRRADLWSGLGLACAYAGRPTIVELEYLLACAQDHVFHFAQGVTFGAEAREFGNIQVENTTRTAMLVCGMTASDAAEVTYQARKGISESSGMTNAFELWRQEIRRLLGEESGSLLTPTGAKAQSDIAGITLKASKL